MQWSSKIIIFSFLTLFLTHNNSNVPKIFHQDIHCLFSSLKIIVILPENIQRMRKTTAKYTCLHTSMAIKIFALQFFPSFTILQEYKNANFIYFFVKNIKLQVLQEQYFGSLWVELKIFQKIGKKKLQVKNHSIVLHPFVNAAASS